MGDLPENRLFQCFSTNAVHLELVLHRLFYSGLAQIDGRCGLPRKIYSDNETNCIGANRKLKALVNFFQENEDNFVERNRRNRWYFIPAHVPYFRGWQETGIKRTKNRLKSCHKYHFDIWGNVPSINTNGINIEVQSTSSIIEGS